MIGKSFILGALVALALAGPATVMCASEPHAGHPEDLKMHEVFYKDWKMPDIRNNGVRSTGCCDSQDCYATPIIKGTGGWYALRREDQRWVPVPTKKLEQNYMGRGEDGRESPDGNSHVCMSPPASYYDGYAFSEAAPEPVKPVRKEDFIIANDSIVYCATLGGAT